MISNPNHVFYACIAKGPTVLAEFSSSNESGIEIVGQRCIEKTPPNHSMFSHTTRNKTYTFLIDDPFAYFAIFDEDLQKSESLWFLNRVKDAFEDFLGAKMMKDGEKMGSFCFQGELRFMFREILALDADLVNALMEESTKDSRNPSLDSTKAKGAVIRPLLPKPSTVFMKKKKRSPGEANGDHHGGDLDNNKASGAGENGSREFSVTMMQKSGGFYTGDGKQKAKQIWKKHVWVVLILDLLVCAVLFGVWLWVCRGLKCIDG
ncbi:PHYTOLONGIN PHYL1.2 [Salix purpurea]|uniref:PHYTOLONGIN PHYL1.2 n=1 Tax=Salix purpurea TaxID=77065 RepID=A0A9Q0W559_SALPP|nr:PHYTOLONGIN PHYL1.2 [Salix purpurea]